VVRRVAGLKNRQFAIELTRSLTSFGCWGEYADTHFFGDVDVGLFLKF